MASGFNWRRLRDPAQERCDNKRWRMELTLMVQEDDNLREDGRRCCKNNLLALAYVLGYCMITEDVHHEAISFFPRLDPDKTVEELALNEKRRRSLLYPRNTYKSTLDLVFCVQVIIVYFMTVAILLMSGGKDLAIAFVDQVASFFIKPPNRPATLFQALFPELCITKQKAPGEFTPALRQNEPKIIEPAIWANSIASSTTGWHPDVLILDDVHNNRNSRSFTTRRRITKDYKLARKVLKPTGIELKIGTPYGIGDIFNDELLTSRPGSYDRIYKPAMKLRNGDRLDANGFPEEDDIELLLPSILSYEFLREEYEAEFESFMSQYMLDSYGAAEVVYSESQLLAAMVDEGNVPMEGQVFIHWRLPCRTQHWATANCGIGILNRNRVFVTDVLQGHYKPSVLARLIHDTARSHGLHTIAIEDAPGARMMQSSIENYALSTGWDIRIQWTPFEEIGERDTRIRNMEALLPSGRLLFSKGIKKLKPVIEGFLQYGMMDETGIPDVVSRLADNLPQSVAAEEGSDDFAWNAMMERDKYNFIYGRGAYAPPEPQPEEMEVEEEERIEDVQFNELGLAVIMPGLE
jgi:hypothetical protein